METVIEASQVCELEDKICEQLSWESANNLQSISSLMGLISQAVYGVCAACHVFATSVEGETESNYKLIYGLSFQKFLFSY